MADETLLRLANLDPLTPDNYDQAVKIMTLLTGCYLQALQKGLPKGTGLELKVKLP